MNTRPCPVCGQDVLWARTFDGLRVAVAGDLVSTGVLRIDESGVIRLGGADTIFQLTYGALIAGGYLAHDGRLAVCPGVLFPDAPVSERGR